MIYNIEKNELIIECSGMDYFRLKTILSNRLPNGFKSQKNFICLPIQKVFIIQDILPQDIKTQPAIKKQLQIVAAHEAARIEVQNILEQSDSKYVTSNWLNILDPAQAVAVSAMVVPGLMGLCLFDEQGSGKTVMTIAAFDILKSAKIINAMIVACPKSMINEWPKDIEKFLPGKYKIVIPEGNKHTKYNSVLQPFDVLIANYETLAGMSNIISGASINSSFLLVVDESFYVKNPDSLRSATICEIRKTCSKCFVLCGTPAPNSAYDLVNQFNLADIDYTFNQFNKTKDINADKEIISEMVETRGTYIRRLKSDILEKVPQKDFHVIRVPLKGRQLAMYENARASLELELKSLDNNTFRKQLITYFQKRAALLQICTNPRAIDPTFNDTPVKYEYLDEIVRDLIGQNRKIILWSFYKISLDEMYERYSKYNPVRVDGTIDNKKRKIAVQSFQEDNDKMIFIGNPAAAGAGITLHSSFDAIYVSYSNQAAHYLQSLDRIHRRGQQSKVVNYYLIICQDTIEETEVIRLRQKELQQHHLLGDQITFPSSLDEALQELYNPSGAK